MRGTIAPSPLRALHDKVFDLDTLSVRLSEVRNNGARLVLCHGCFDPVHVGHMRYFREARAQGDILVVTVTCDAYVDKGPDRPVFPEALRAEAIASLESVDFVAVNPAPTAAKVIQRLKPAVYCKGGEFRDVTPNPKLQQELNAVSQVGGRMHFTNDIVFSSTALVAKFMESS